jgi:hypothetical protein
MVLDIARIVLRESRIYIPRKKRACERNATAEQADARSKLSVPQHDVPQEARFVLTRHKRMFLPGGAHVPLHLGNQGDRAASGVPFGDERGDAEVEGR